MRIKAGQDVRLACQLCPGSDVSITPLVMASQPTAEALHAGGVQGHEEYVVAMFVDMRGSTNLGERVLAYDVVFILNRFFTELSEALAATHGHYAQFAGDGLMALYGLDPERKQRACRDALDGATDMFRRIDKLNRQLQQEFNESVQMGIGIHGGEAIVGTMGPPRTPLLTAVGDNINIAARLEAKTKEIGCDLIVSVAPLEAEGIDYNNEVVHEIDVRGRDQLPAFQRLDAALCLTRLIRLGAEAVDVTLHVGNALLLFYMRRLLLREPFGTLYFESGIVATIQIDVLIFDVCNAIHHGVQKIAVVGDQ